MASPSTFPSRTDWHRASVEAATYSTAERAARSLRQELDGVIIESTPVRLSDGSVVMARGRAL